MTFSALQGAAAGAIVTGAFVAFALRPPTLTAPTAPATPPSVEVAAAPPNDTSHAERQRHTTTMVYVAGAVVHPGMYAVPDGARAFDAVTKAGGLTHDADPVAVNLAAHVADGDEIAVPHVGDAPAAATAPQSHAGSHKRSRRAKHHRSPRRAAPAADATGAGATALVDLNAADEATLATVPGIGPTLAQRIVEFRAVNGRFTSVDGLLDVSGVSSSRFDAIASFLTVGPP